MEMGGTCWETRGGDRTHEGPTAPEQNMAADIVHVVGAARTWGGGPAGDMGRRAALFRLTVGKIVA